jgi:hypothetical protein
MSASDLFGGKNPRNATQFSEKQIFCCKFLFLWKNKSNCDRKQFCFWGRVGPHSCLPKHLKSSLEKSHQLSQICLGMLVTLAPLANWKTEGLMESTLDLIFFSFLQKERENVNCWLQTQNVHNRKSVVVRFSISKRPYNLYPGLANMVEPANNTLQDP